MAQIVVIKSETARDGLQYIGDIVGVFSDEHNFSPTEIEKFDILTINGSVTDVEAVLNQITPTIYGAFLWDSDGEYHWEPPTDGSGWQDLPVYQIEGDKRWYKVENEFKFPVSVSSLTPEEKQILETVDINHPSVDSFIRKLVKDITVLSGNDIEVVELRNTSPVTS